MVELIVVVAIIGLLAALILPAYDLAKVKAQRTFCGSQVQQLQIAWAQFSDDNGDALVENQPLLGPGLPNDACWFTGSARTEHDEMYGPAPYYTSTNKALAKNSRLYSYVNSTDVFRCPADHRNVDGRPVVRSYSMNCWMNGQTMGDPSGLVSQALDDRKNDDRLIFRFFRKLGQITRPSDLSVFIEESETTLADSMFAVVKDLPAMRDIADLPGNRHRGSFVLGYADGHASYRRFTQPGLLRGFKSPEEANRALDKDLIWLGSLATEAR